MDFPRPLDEQLEAEETHYDFSYWRRVFGDGRIVGM
jgi:hypothetical protein